MGTETLNSYTTTGITLSPAGTYNSPFTVTTAGTVNASGFDGVYSSSPSPSLLNQGSITASSYGVYFQDGGTVTNNGTLSGGGTGVQINNAAGTVTNTGTIAGGNGLGGVYLQAGGSIANIGSAAKIYGGVFGAFMGYAPASTVANGGTITGSLAGVYLDDGGTFTNTASYALITGGQYGLRANNAAATIGNAGSINGGSAGIYLSDGGTVSNSGTISGGSAIFAQNGSFTLYELAGGVFQGAVTDQPGHGVLNLAGTNAGALDLGGSFSGFATINFGAAAWTLGGTSSELANGETITGFVLGDTVQLEDFAATSASYIAGTGLVLSNATASETIHFSGGDQYFSIASVGKTGTDIIAANPSLYHTLATSITNGITLAATGNYRSPFTVTTTGTINTAGAAAIYSHLAAPYLLNQGAIIATVANDAAGMILSDGGTIVNTASGVIEGELDGVVVNGAAATVNNAGIIDAIKSTGVLLTAGGTVTNTGTITGGVRIEGAGNNRVVAGNDAVFTGGVIAQGSNNTLEFTGGGKTIASIGTQFTGFQTIQFDTDSAWVVGGDAAAIAALATITGFGVDDAIDITGFSASSIGYTAGVGVVLSNAAASYTFHIGGGGSFGIASDGNGGTDIVIPAHTLSRDINIGISLGSNSQFESPFTITTTGTVQTTGDYAVYSYLAGADLLNQGSVINSRFFGYGVKFTGGGTVTNIDSAVIQAAFGGIVIDFGYGTVSNDGTITATSSAGTGVQLFTGGTVSNSGTIAGGKYAVYIDGAGDNLVVAGNEAVFTGAVKVLGTNNTLEFAGTGGTVASIGGQFTGFQTIAFDPGAAWSLSGSAAELGGLATITGISVGDNIDLTDFAATAASYTAGTGLMLSNASASLVLSLSGDQYFGITSDGHGGTEIIAATHTLSTTLGVGISLSTIGPYLNPFTVTSTGRIDTGGAIALYSNIANTTLVNQGNILATNANEGFIGVDLADGGTLLNTGFIAGVNFGVRGTNATVINDGFIGATTDLFVSGPSGNYAVKLSGDHNLVVAGNNAVFKGVVQGGGDGTVEFEGTPGFFPDFTNGRDDAFRQWIGFETIKFDPGSNWSFADTITGLDTMTITGFSPGDKIFIRGFTATSEQYTAGVGLRLSNGSSSYLINISGGGNFGLSRDPVGYSYLYGTEIVALNPTGSTYHTLSTTNTNGITLQQSIDAVGPFTVTQTGLVKTSAANGFSNQVYATDVLINQGSIIAGTYGVNFNAVIADGTYAPGIHYNATVTNAAGAYILGGKTGIRLSNGDGTLSNAGTVFGVTGDGVYLHNGGYVTNAASGIIAGDQTGIDDPNVWIRVSNSGIISGGTEYGVYLKNQSTVTNTGTIAGGNAAVDIVGTGDAKVVAGNGAVFIGNVEAGGTGNTLEFAGAGNMIASIGGQFFGFQTIAFDPGAAWTIAGNAAALTALATLTGFGIGDEIDVTDFAATAASYIAGTGLVLSNATASETLHLAGAGTVAIAGDGAAGTDIFVATHTLSISINTGITLTTTGRDLDPFTITATGTINGGGYGVYSSLSGAYLLNDGVIKGAAVDGVRFNNGGTVINAGTIVNAGPEVKGAPIYAGLIIQGTAGSVSNTGSIAGSNYGVYLANGGTVTNTGTIVGHDLAGVVISTPNGVVANTTSSAVIYGAQDGVVLAGRPFTGTLINDGTIIGHTYAGIRLASHDATVTNSGTIAGGAYAIFVFDTGGAFTLNERAGGVFKGEVQDGAGDGVLNLAGATAGTLDMGGSFSGFTNINFGPAAWTLAGTGSELTNNQTITGFTLGDEIDLTDFAATTARYITGTGLVLSNATARETLHVTGGDGAFSITADGHGGTDITAKSLCYLHGTRILTPTGQVAVEDLRIGDTVVTRFGGIQTIKWLGRQRYAARFIANNPEKWPVRIRAGALGPNTPARDLFVSPNHSMLLGDTLVLASHLINGITITQTKPETEVNYVQLDLGQHDCVVAEGAWSETYADAPGLRAQFYNAAEYEALYPDEPPPDALHLCADRPERGPKLAAALLPVTARAAAEVPLGGLEGYVDIVEDWTIEAWARDTANPDLPVQLEILVGGQVIAAVLACDYREDLRQAGKGTGRCAFTFTPPFRLRAETLTTLTIRRPTDATELPGIARFRDPSAQETNAPREAKTMAS